MDTIRALLAVGNEEIEGQIRNLRGISVIDSGPDIDIIADVLDYEEADYVIVNTVLSEAKSRALAEKAREKGTKVIAIIGSRENKALTANLMSFGVAAIVDFTELDRIPGYLREYPREVDFVAALRKGEVATKREKSAIYSDTERLRGKLCVGVFGATRGSGVTTTAIAMAESMAKDGYKVAVVGLDGTDDLACIETRKAGASYYPFSKSIEEDVRELYQDASYQFFIFDFGTIYPVDRAGNLLDCSVPAWIATEFARCPYKVALTFADPWHADKLLYHLQNTFPRTIPGLKNDTCYLLYSGAYGMDDFESEFPWPAYRRTEEEVEMFIRDFKRSIGLGAFEGKEDPVKRKWPFGKKKAGVF